MSWAGKTYWIVGASEGLGRALAHELSRCGATVIVSARNADRLSELAAELPGPAIAAPLDVADAASVQAAFDALPAIDGVVYAAGVYEPLGAKQWNTQAVEAMCDINFTGAARVLGRAVPALIARGGGHIAIIGSLAGLRGLPRAIGYGASKAGVMHLAETLRADLAPPAFTVQVINPGFIETRLTDKNSFQMPFIMTPEDAARRTRRAMETRRFRTDFPKRFALFFWLAGLLPNALYFRLAAR